MIFQVFLIVIDAAVIMLNAYNIKGAITSGKRAKKYGDRRYLIFSRLLILGSIISGAMMVIHAIFTIYQLRQ